MGTHGFFCRVRDPLRMMGVQATNQIFVIVITTNLICGFQTRCAGDSSASVGSRHRELREYVERFCFFKFYELLNIRDLPIDILDILKPPA